MKKLLLSLLLLNLFTVPINAETYFTDGNYQISLSYINKSAYTVKIPKQLDVSNNTTILPYYVKGSIYFDQVLKVIFDKQTTLHYLNSQVNVFVSQNNDTYSYTQLTDSYTYQEAIIIHNKLAPGNYSGTLNVVISLEEGVYHT